MKGAGRGAEPHGRLVPLVLPQGMGSAVVGSLRGGEELCLALGAWRCELCGYRTSVHVVVCCVG